MLLCDKWEVHATRPWRVDVQGWRSTIDSPARPKVPFVHNELGVLLVAVHSVKLALLDFGESVMEGAWTLSGSRMMFAGA
jgi:hypothetical protein